MNAVPNSIEAVSRFLQEEADHFLVVAHVNPDGDAIGSTLAIKWMLEALDKSYTLINESNVPEKFRFLPGADEIHTLDQLVGKSFSHVITLDCGDRTRVGEVAKLFAENVRICNIDHHSTNDLFGVVNYVDVQAAATVELLYRLAEHLGLDFSLELATCIYTGLLTDTGSFQFSNTTPEVMRQAAHLMELGVPSAKIADHVMLTNTYSQLKILQRALATLQVSENQKIAWLKVSCQDLEDCGATVDDTEGIVQYARGVEGVEVGILFRETSNHQVKVSLRSRSKINVAQIAKQFGGGGHARAAGCILDISSLDEAASQVVKAAEKAWEELER